MTPDLRGHGDSQWTRASSYAWLEYVQDIAQLVRQAPGDGARVQIVCRDGASQASPG